MKMRYLWIAVGLGAVACATTQTFPWAIPPGARVFRCNGDGDCLVALKRPQCASENSKCVNGECAYYPRTYAENPNGYCECYKGQMAECLTHETPCGKSSAVAWCEVTDDTHSKWNQTCWNLAKDAGPL